MPKTRSEAGSQVNVRVPSVARRQLDDLMEQWGENASQTLLRCVERTWAWENRETPEGKVFFYAGQMAIVPEILLHALSKLDESEQYVIHQILDECGVKLSDWMVRAQHANPLIAEFLGYTPKPK